MLEITIWILGIALTALLILGVVKKIKRSHRVSKRLKDSNHTLEFL